MSERVRIGDEYWFQPPTTGRSGLILDEDLDVIGYCNGTVEHAQMWVDGYAFGLIRGERVGEEKMRRAMRDVLGVPHPKGEE